MKLSEELDALLERSDTDSSDWTDGVGHRRALQLLGAFTEEDWAALPLIAARRDSAWRACLADALTPRQGAAARRLMLELTNDPDEETAFIATMAVAFYCGVNDGPEGAFMDRGRGDAGLVLDARSTPGLVDRVRRVAADCDPRFGRRLELLIGVLTSDPS